MGGDVASGQVASVLGGRWQRGRWREDPGEGRLGGLEGDRKAPLMAKEEVSGAVTQSP